MERINYRQRHLRTASLFAGAGGLDLGFLNAGFDIIWSNDFDKYAVQSYRASIGEHIHEGDITRLWEEVPPHDVLIGGFPCQPFSMMGAQRGFDDERGTLFFYIQRILERHNPNIIVLENVKGLETHDGGRTFQTMTEILENDLDYILFSKVLNTADFGIPHTRRRLFIVGFKREFYENNQIEFSFPQPIELTEENNVRNILDEEVGKKYFLSKKILPTIMSNGTRNYYSRAEINLNIARPLCATMHKMHRASQDNYYTDEVNRDRFEDTEEKRISNIRRLTPNECRKLQGFPSDWQQVVSDTQAYRQFGNAVTVDVAYHLAMEIVKSLSINLERER
ncbi:MAG: DNA cytosine methyltransferase [Tepidibacter sp.]|jgi:DNA (cytosine-5)-methyltransferase 1|uniref:DNA cytosine methyltransferase n=1 Tax=Tepidibacter sp. TaxID=2529387 RepID=UPI0025F5DE74|nr:DNA cytosine methyltransferase [Tepidibacter sp.]MCT4508237.1 DNA cytosine methyltransferase [Tepidibacter sp.]